VLFFRLEKQIKKLKGEEKMIRKTLLEDLREVVFQVSQEKRRKCPFRILSEIEEIKKRGIIICPFAGPGCTLEASRSCQYFQKNKEKVWGTLAKNFPFPRFCPCLIFKGMQGNCDIYNRNEIAKRLNLDSCWLRTNWEGEEMVICLLRELTRLNEIGIKT